MKVLGRIEEFITAVALAFMTILTFANVISRYVFHASFSFSEEITSSLFVLLSLMGPSIAAKNKAHLGLTILTDHVSAPVAKVLHIISYIIALIFSFAILYYGVLMVISQYQLGQRTAAMAWPEWIYGSFVPIGAFFITVRFAELLIKEIKSDPHHPEEVIDNANPENTVEEAKTK